MICDLLLYLTLGGQRPAVGLSLCCSDRPSGTNCESPWLEVECGFGGGECQVVYPDPHTDTYTHPARSQLSWSLTGDGVSQLDVSEGCRRGVKESPAQTPNISHFTRRKGYSHMEREGSTPPDYFPLVVSQMILLRCVNCMFGIHFYERKGAWERSEKCWGEHNIKLMSLAHEY